jgi:2-octaprenyl-6-methoxyphenol hydroxylase
MNSRVKNRLTKGKPSVAGEVVDVAIVGGGLVGASLACALAPLGLKIALLEAVPPRAANQPSYDDRTLALSASSCAILRGLGVWPLLAETATAIREVHVSEINRAGKVVLRPTEFDLEEFGHVVEARVFGSAVMKFIDGLESVDFTCPAKVDSIETGQDLTRIEFVHGDEQRFLQARLLVGADGADSIVRKALGVAAQEHDYGQTAVICNVSTEKPHQGKAYECFTSTGPFALLPHVNDRCGLVWSTTTEQANELLDWSDDEFLNQAQARFGTALGQWNRIGKRSAYPLRLVRAKQDIGKRAVILGNAAHAIHPIGAQGFNLGLRDVAVLAELIAAALQKDAAADIGLPELLQTYSEWRAPDHEGTIAWSDGLARLYANPTGIASFARGAGLLAHALIPSLRRQLAVRAMGYRGRIPRLALGETLVGN